MKSGQLLFCILGFLAMSTAASAVESTKTLYISSSKSPLSDNVLDYMKRHPELRDQIRIVDVHADPDAWSQLKKDAAACRISEANTGLPTLIAAKDQMVECRSSDHPVIDKLREWNGCSMLNTCVARSKKFAAGHWQTQWIKEANVRDVCAGNKGSSAHLSLEGKYGMSLQILQDTEAVLEIYEGKLTYIVAQAKAAIPSLGLGLVYRPPGAKTQVIDIECR